MSSNLGNKRFRLTQEHARKGGQSRSKQKLLACKLNPVKNPSTMRRVLVEETDLQVEALKNLVRLSSRNGKALLDEMIEALQKYKLLVTDTPTIRNVDAYLRILFEFKRTIWGDKLILEAKEQGLSFSDLCKLLPDHRHEETENKIRTSFGGSE